MKRIVTPRPDGGIDITTPAIPEQINDVLNMCAPGSYIVDSADLPPDRTFRDAWMHDGKGGVTIDTNKVPSDKVAEAQAQIAAKKVP